MYHPQFTITSDINNALIEIEQLKQKIELAKILPQQIIRLRHRATVEDAHSSTTIEGNTLNKKQVEDVFSGKLNSAEYVVIEVANYKKALDLVNKHYQPGEQLSTHEALQLHSLVAKDLLPTAKVGKFRPGPIFVADIINGREIIRYEGPPANKLKSYLNDLFSWLKQEKKLLKQFFIRRELRKN